MAVKSQIAFAVEAVAASEVRDLAQDVRRWQGRAFLPLLHAVGLGSLAGAEEAWSPGVLVMELADSTLQEKKFKGEALIMVAWALASTLALLNEAGFSESGNPPPINPQDDLHPLKGVAPQGKVLAGALSTSLLVCILFRLLLPRTLNGDRLPNQQCS